jgi:hypothetical protein
MNISGWIRSCVLGTLALATLMTETAAAIQLILQSASLSFGEPQHPAEPFRLVAQPPSSCRN